MKNTFQILVSSLMVMTAHSNAQDIEFNPIQDQGKIPVLSPTLAERKTFKMQLKNGTEVYLISDPDADQSAAAITVGVGSWDEPKDYPGIAHFLEHMLFLGTKTYPEESGFSRFVSENGGTYNAFTSNGYTAYLFSVNTSAYVDAVHRFSSFFKEPLFNPSGVLRELKAIDQEYAKNIENDDVRILYVLKELSNPAHPDHHFNMGNSQTLSKVSQDVLKEFYHDNYSSNLMRLVLYSSLPMEQLKELVVKDFAPIENKHNTPAIVTTPLLLPKSEPQMVYVVPIKNLRHVTLLWPLPVQFAAMIDTRPDKLVAYVLGHEGKESLLASLKRDHLAEALSSGAFNYNKDNLVFGIDIDLTLEGTQKIDEVISRVFQTIARLRRDGIPPYLFNEIQQMSKLRYQYQRREEPFNYMMNHSSWMPYEPLASYPEKTHVIQKFDSQGIQLLLNELTPKNAFIAVAAPEEVTKITPQYKEQWLGVQYSLKTVPSDVFKKWENPSLHPDISLPAQNPLIPSNFEIFGKKSTDVRLIPIPQTLLNDDYGKIYFSQDQRYLTPEISWIFDVKSPQMMMGNPQKTVLTDLYVKSITEALSELRYSAALAGLNLGIARSNYGIRLKISGYNDKALVFLEQVLKQFSDFNVPEEKFNLYLESLSRDYHNFQKDTPLTQAADLLENALIKKDATQKQLAIASKKMTFEKFLAFKEKFLEYTYVESTLFGNMPSNYGMEVWKKWTDILASRPYKLGKDLRKEVIKLPADEGPLYLEQKATVQGNAIILAVEYPTFNHKERAAQQILAQGMQEPFFSALRTQQQTGYIVYSSAQEIERHLFIFFFIQSNTHDVLDLLFRTELFIENFLNEMSSKEISPERFEVMRQALLAKVKQPPRNAQEMGDMLFLLGFDYQGDFDWMNKRIEGFEKLTYEEFLTISNAYLNRQNKRRLGILMEGQQPIEEKFHYTPIPNVNALKKISTFSGV